MIQANELRIGNWFQWSQFASMGIGEHQIKEAIVIGQYNNLKNGIQLTPEWLLKAGAINKHGCEYYIGKLKFTYEHNELSQFVRFHYSGKVAYLQYVHQLQNLYFALTGQELSL